MKTNTRLQNWIYRITDSDKTWYGLGWMRPEKHTHLGPGYIILASILLGLPGITVGAGFIYLVLGQVTPGAWLWLFALALLIELPLNIVVAYYWNQRAKELTTNI